MNLDLVNDLFSNLKENKLVQNFMKELSNYLEKNLSNNNFSSNSWIDLSNDDLTIFDTKITTKFRDEMLVERNNILQPRKPARPRFGSLRKDGRNFRPLSEKKQQPATQAALNQTGAQKAQLHFPQNSPYATNAAGQKNRKLSRRQNFCRSF